MSWRDRARSFTRDYDEIELVPEDPVRRAYHGTRDLYGIATWENRSILDATAVYLASVVTPLRFVLFLLLSFLVFELIANILEFLLFPLITWFSLLSTIPSLAVAVYIWYTDAQFRQPVRTLAITFGFTFVFMSGIALLNTAMTREFRTYPIVGLLSAFLFIAPIEEVGKLLSVRLYAYRRAEFSTVLDGVVYGAFSGLAFAFVENFGYILAQVAAGQDPGSITMLRAFSGIGHVVYTAIAGYYLGLAKFNRENAYPIIIKGLLIVILFHGSFNTFVPLSGGLGLIVWIVIDGGAILYLFFLITRYKRVYRTIEPESGDRVAVPSEATVDASSSVKDRLQDLQGLHRAGVITEAEYERKREEILENL